MIADERAAGRVGTSRLRVEDHALLTGVGGFIDDLDLPGVLHVALLRSPVGHAEIRRLDVSPAVTAGGALAAFGGADVRASCGPFRVHITTPGAHVPDRDLLAFDRVRYVGEPVAAVVAESRYRAEDALEEIDWDYRQLPAVASVEAALAADAPQIHDGVPGNVYFHGSRSFGDVDAAFAAADLVVEGDVRHPRVSASPLECRGVAAAPAGGAGVTVWSSTQCAHLVATAVSEICGLPRDRVRVVTPDVGGGFGLKAHVYPEEVLLAWIALRVGRPVKWIEDRSEHLQAASHARDQVVRFGAAVRSDGRVLGLRATLHADMGAYGIRPHGPLLDPMTAAGLMTGPYDIRDYAYDTFSVATNKVPMGPYRGVGMVTAALAYERLMDLVAARLGLDPADVRRRNFIPSSAMPYTTVTGHPYESGDYGATLERALRGLDYREAREEQRRARAHGRLVGIGLCSYVEFTGAGSSTFVGRGMVGIPGTERARVWLAEDGEVRVQTTCPAIGQGIQTTLAQVVATRMGIDAGQVLVEQTDTARVGDGTGSFNSRSSVTAATCSHRAAAALREEILSAASWRLDEPVESLELTPGGVSVSGGPAALTLREMAAGGKEANGGHGLDVEILYDPVQASHPYATHACVVEVDPETGGVSVLRYVVADDCGPMINPTIVEGQVLGGLTQGLAGALLEEILYSPEAQPLTGTFMDYLVPTAPEVPAVEVHHLETPSTVHELGTKGVGEGGTIGATAAIANAVADALGTDVGRLPLTPERVRALADRAGLTKKGR